MFRAGAKLGVMIEVNCETDFVAKSTEFQELAKALAMQVAACPTVEVVDASAIPADWVEKEKIVSRMPHAHSPSRTPRPTLLPDTAVAHVA